MLSDVIQPNLGSGDLEMKNKINQQQLKVEDDDDRKPPPLLARLAAVFFISCISFSSHWSSGVTGAMKSTLKKVETNSRQCML